MSTQPVNPGRPPPYVPVLLPNGKWGLAPSASPQGMHPDDGLDAYPLIWWIMALLIGLLILAAFFAI
jgi:hypothetical protein